MKEQSTPHDYYYGSEAEQYTFYRFPKALFQNERYKGMSDSAKILYGLMLDRMGLSLKNGWLDKRNRVFIYFTLEDLQEYMNCGHNKGVKLMAELDNIGLIERVKQGLGRPAIIYVKRFANDNGNPIQPPPDGSYPGGMASRSALEFAHGSSANGSSDQPQDYAQGSPDFRKEESQTSDNGKSRLPQKGTTDFPKADANKNELNNPEFNKNNLSKNNPIQSYRQQPEPADGLRPASRSSPHGLDMDGMSERNLYRELIEDNIEYEYLIGRYDRERVDELVELMLDTVCSKRDYLTVSGDDFPKEVIKSRLLKLNSGHIEYAFDCIDRNTTKVRNVRKYLLATLYNAPTTMETYYRAEVNHDLYGSSAP